MILSGNIAQAFGLPEEEQAGLKRLIDIFNQHAGANEVKRRYYEGHIRLSEVNLGLALPKRIMGLEIGCAWGEKTVDVLAARSMFDGFVGANGEQAQEMGRIAEANKLQAEYMKTCKDELNEALRLAQGAVTQREVDEAAEKLKEALACAVERETLEGLQLLLTQADALTNENGAVYTENSWASLQAVKAICRELTEQSGEYEISYWYKALEARINGLISFVTEVRS